MEFYICVSRTLIRLSYRNAQHATTGTTPAKLFLQRELCIRLSLVHPDISLHVTNNQTKMKTCYDRHTKFRTLSPGDRVLARDHPSKEKWRTGTIVIQHVTASYCIHLDDGRLWRRHIDDLLGGPLQNQTAAPQVLTAIKASPVIQEPSIPVVSSDHLSGAPSHCLYRILKLLRKGKQRTSTCG